MSQQTRPNDNDCIFCKIVAGEIPCHRLYEDKAVLAFLDVGPLAHGHALVIPKAHYATLDQAPAELVGGCAQTAARLGQAIAQAVEVTAWNVLQNNGAAAGQVVGHVHFHIIPRRGGDGLGYRWNAGEINHDDAKALAKQIVEAMK